VQQSNSDYTAKDIQVLEGLEAVRVRPGMYIGSTDQRGLHHLIYEVLDNAVDEAMAGFCDTVKISLDSEGIITVIDNGRGIPIDIHPTTGTTALEFNDLFLNDSGSIQFGDDQDTTLVHTDGTGLTLNSTNKLCFYDTALYIHSSTDGQLDLVADTEIQIAATTIDINGAVALNGAITGATNITLSGELDSATLDVSGNADIDGTTNLDAVDIDGAVQIDAAFTSGVDGQGYDTKFFGDTSSAYILWDTSADKLLTAGGAVIDIVKDKLLIGGTAVTTTAAELNLLMELHLQLQN